MSSYGLWLSAAGMQATEYRQAVLANNLANAQTTGFKQDIAIVQQRRIESRENAGGASLVHPVFDGMSGGIAAVPTMMNRAQGNLDHTGNPLDLAIDGTGFFTVSDGQTTRYTRDGALTVNQSGELALTAGGGRWTIRDAGGATIAPVPGRGTVQVSSDGTVRQDGAVLGQIDIVEPEREESLRKVGGNLFELETGGVMARATGRVSAGNREQSNFDPMTGMAAMLEASRAYQLNATLIQLQDQSTGLAVSRVGRVA